MKKAIPLILFTITAIAFFLRIYRIASVPPSPSLDEVSIGYNAFSVLRTGRDEYGTFMPLILRAYDDYRPVLYMYLVVPFVAVLGLTATAVRLPAVILGTLAVLGTYAVARELLLTGRRGSGSAARKPVETEAVPLLAAFLVAVSPWHIYISRLGHEVNAGVTSVIIGVFLFLLYVRIRRPWCLIGSAVVFALSLYTYQSEKIVTPVLSVVLFGLFRKELRTDIKALVLSLAIGMVIILPALFQLTDRSNLIRFRATNAYLNSPEYIQTVADYPAIRQSGSLIDRLQKNPKAVALKIMVSNYLSHFNPRWVFAGGPKESHKIPYTGLLYPWEAPFLILGILFTALGLSRKTAAIIMSWFLVSILPASITTMAPHAMRTMTVVPVTGYFTAYGIYKVITKIPGGLRRTFSVAALTLIAASGIFRMYDLYINVFPLIHSGSFQYALNNAIPELERESASYRRVVVSNRDQLTQSYMFYLFHTGTDPGAYLSAGGTGSGGYDAVHTIGKFSFRPIDRQNDRDLTGTLFAGNPDEFEPPNHLVSVFDNLDGEPAVTVVSSL